MGYDNDKPILYAIHLILEHIMHTLTAHLSVLLSVNRVYN